MQSNTLKKPLKAGDVTSFTVTRSNWGNYRMQDKLTGKYCVLGFYAKACGQKRMKNKLVPRQWPDWETVFADDALAGEFTVINDDDRLADEAREEMLRLKFLEYGIDVSFVD